MAQQSRKGFNFVKKSGNIVTDKVDFDQLDANTPNNKTSGKRKSEGGSGKSEKPRTATAKRSRYPVINYSFDSQKNKSSSSSYSEGQYQQLITVLTGVCKNEMTGLLQHFKSNKPKSICSNLVGVLDSLPRAMSEYPIDDKFYPEHSKEERKELQELLHERNELRAFFNRLTELNESPEVLNSQYDMWSSSDRVTRNTSSFNKEFSQRSKALENTVTEYRQLLKSLEARCDVIIGGTGELKSQLDAAKQAQDEVYDVFNKARLETSSSSAGTRTHNVPADPKDVLRQFSTLNK